MIDVYKYLVSRLAVSCPTYVRACMRVAGTTRNRTVTRVRSRETTGLLPPTPRRGKLMTTRSLYAPREISQMASRVLAGRLERNRSEGRSAINFFYQCTPRECRKVAIKARIRQTMVSIKQVSTSHRETPVLDVAVTWYVGTGRMLIGKTRKRDVFFYTFFSALIHTKPT